MNHFLSLASFYILCLFAGAGAAEIGDMYFPEGWRWLSIVIVVLCIFGVALGSV